MSSEIHQDGVSPYGQTILKKTGITITNNFPLPKDKNFLTKRVRVTNVLNGNTETALLNFGESVTINYVNSGLSIDIVTETQKD